jgi:hypothetical protein
MQIGESLDLREISNIIKSADSDIVSFGSSSNLLDSYRIKYRDGSYEFEESFSGLSNPSFNVETDCLIIPSTDVLFELEIV